MHHHSIGFRSPTAQELAQQFLGYLQDTLQLDGIYADPDLKHQAHSAQISDQMIDRVAETLQRITWTRDDVRGFLGAYLTEPKPHVFFDSPDEPLEHDEFVEACSADGYRLDARSLLLLPTATSSSTARNRSGRNRRPAHAPGSGRQPPRRHIAGLSEEGIALLYDWYCCGFAHPSANLME